MTSSMSEGLCCIVWMYIVYIYDVVGHALTFFTSPRESKEYSRPVMLKGIHMYMCFG